MDTILNQALEKFLGLLRQLITNLLGPHGFEWGEELKKFLKKQPSWEQTDDLTRKDFGSMCCVRPVSSGISGIPSLFELDLVQVGNLFRGGVDPNFLEGATGLKDQSVLETPTSHYILTKHATGQDIFGRHDLDKFCLTNAQIIMWAILNKDYLPSAGSVKGRSFLFLFKGTDGFFIAKICFFNEGVGWPRGLKLSTQVLSDNYVFDPSVQTEIVIPQLSA